MTHQYNDESRTFEEAAFLPEADPRRRAIADEIEGSGEVHDAWCAILAENEGLRLRLRDVEVPDGLAERARCVREGKSRRRVTPLSGRVIAAAVLVLAIVLGVSVVRIGGSGSADAAAYNLAMLAAMDHAARPEMAVRTTEMATLASSLGGRLPFDLSIAAPEPGAILVGGRLCSFGDRPIIYTRWRTAHRDVAVYQMESRAFGLHSGFGPVDIKTPQDGSPDSRCDVRVWTDDRFAYVAVDDRRRSGG